MQRAQNLIQWARVWRGTFAPATPAGAALDEALFAPASTAITCAGAVSAAPSIVRSAAVEGSTSTGALAAVASTIAASATEKTATTSVLSAVAATLAAAAQELYAVSGAPSAVASTVAGTAYEKATASVTVSASSATIAAVASESATVTGTALTIPAALAAAASERALASVSLLTIPPVATGQAQEVSTVAGCMAAAQAVAETLVLELVNLSGSSQSLPATLVAFASIVGAGGLTVTGALTSEPAGIGGVAIVGCAAVGMLRAGPTQMSVQAFQVITVYGGASADFATVVGVLGHGKPIPVLTLVSAIDGDVVLLSSIHAGGGDVMLEGVQEAPLQLNSPVQAGVTFACACDGDLSLSA